MERNIQRIPLNSIKLDQQNVRFGGDVAQSQREAIELMMADVEDIKKLVKLSEHIAQNGLDPTELQLVYPESEDSYVVIEGNRRLTALKMLQNPLLCPVEKYVRSFRDAQERLMEICHLRLSAASLTAVRKVICG
ncbi:ParB N-terminal domain-containing protein [Vibrio olivae]